MQQSHCLFMDSFILQTYKTQLASFMMAVFHGSECIARHPCLHHHHYHDDDGQWWLILRCQMAFLMSKLKFAQTVHTTTTTAAVAVASTTSMQQCSRFYAPASLNVLNFQTILNSNSMRREKWHFITNSLMQIDRIESNHHHQQHKI